MIARYNRELLEAYRRGGVQEEEAAPPPPDAPPPPLAEDTTRPTASPTPPVEETTSPAAEERTPLPSEIARLQVWVTTASAALPITGAHVTVSDAATGEERTVRYSGETDESGRSEVIPLPAASAQGSLSPEGQPTPFTLYDVEVSADGFYRVENRGLPMYGGVLAIQPVRMIPLPEGGFQGNLIYQDSAPVGLEERT